MKTCRTLLSLAALLAIAGCADRVGPPDIAPVQGEPIGVQLKRVVPPLQTQRFSTLLDFENDSDGVFVAAAPPARMVYDRAHTGKRSLRIDPQTQRVSVKLSSVMSGRPFPGEWTLIGGFLFTEQPLDVMLSVEGAGFNVAPRKVRLTPGTWSMAMLDISPAATQLPSGSAAAATDARLVFAFGDRGAATAGPVWCDDVLLVNNAKTLVSNDWAAAQVNPVTGSPTTAPWKLSQEGLNYVGEMPAKFGFKLATAEAVADGWRITEANDVRAQFESDGQTKHLTIYADGRSYWDGKLKGISRDVRDNRTFAEQHDSPAEVTVPEELGRVNRQSDGDANNDGYNERRGAYQLIANESRLEVTFSPRSSALLRPVLEITGLPAGEVLVTVEGKLIEKATRLSDGTLLVLVPARIDRTTTISLRVQ